MSRGHKQELLENYQEMEFRSAMLCITIIRYITDHSKLLPVSALHHLIVNCDVLCVLVPLIEIRPWIRENNKRKCREQFYKNGWHPIDKSDYSKVVKLEIQVWLSIYNIFMDEECRRKYEFNEFRKANILSVKKYMNELLLD